MNKKYNINPVFFLMVIMNLTMVLHAANEPDELWKQDIEEPVFVYDRENRPDPFIPLINKSEIKKTQQLSLKDKFRKKLEKISVNGILWDAKEPLVMINNKIYRQKDIVDEELTIEKIDDNSIILIYKGLVEKIILQKGQED